MSSTQAIVISLVIVIDLVLFAPHTSFPSTPGTRPALFAGSGCCVVLLVCVPWCCQRPEGECLRTQLIKSDLENSKRHFHQLIQILPRILFHALYKCMSRDSSCANPVKWPPFPWMTLSQTLSSTEGPNGSISS